MKAISRLAMAMMCAAWGIMLISPAWAQSRRAASDDFMPGSRPQVGVVKSVEGQVTVRHYREEQGYWLQDNLPVFADDLITTGADGRAHLTLADHSELIISSDSRMVLSRSQFDPKRRVRDSYVNLVFGKVRCMVKKYTSYSRSSFMVKTKTSIIGVRGSDFIVVAVQPYTRVIALDDTVLEVVGAAFPDARPTIVGDFQQTYIREGDRPSPVENVPDVDIPILKQEFKTDPTADALTKSLPSSQETVYRSFSPMGSLTDAARPSGSIESRRPVRTGSKSSTDETATNSSNQSSSGARATEAKPRDAAPERAIELAHPASDTFLGNLEPIDLSRSRDLAQTVEVAQEQRKIIIEENLKENLTLIESPWFPTMPE